MADAELGSLPPAELNSLAEGLQGDLQLLSDSAQKLQGAVARFHQSGVALEALEVEAEGACASSPPPPLGPPWSARRRRSRVRDAGKPMLVPLTQSLYAPGRLGDTGRVLIDIGTGYFVEARNPAAVAPPRAARTALAPRRGGRQLTLCCVAASSLQRTGSPSAAARYSCCEKTWTSSARCGVWGGRRSARRPRAATPGLRRSFPSPDYQREASTPDASN
jgi:prefoldin subunit 5